MPSWLFKLLKGLKEHYYLYLGKYYPQRLLENYTVSIMIAR